MIPDAQQPQREHCEHEHPCGWWECYAEDIPCNREGCIDDTRTRPHTPAPCTWKEDDDGNWDTTCGHTWTFFDGSIRSRPHTPAPDEPIEGMILVSVQELELLKNAPSQQTADEIVELIHHRATYRRQQAARTATLTLLEELVNELEGYGECSDVEMQRNFGISVVKTRLIALQRQQAGE